MVPILRKALSYSAELCFHSPGSSLDSGWVVGSSAPLPLWASFPLFSYPRTGFLEDASRASSQSVLGSKLGCQSLLFPFLPALPGEQSLLVASRPRIFRRPKETCPFAPLSRPSRSWCLSFVWPAFLARAQGVDFLQFLHVGGWAVLGQLTLFSPSAPL